MQVRTEQSQGCHLRDAILMTDSHRDQCCTYVVFDDSRKLFNDPTYRFDECHMDLSYVRIRAAHSHKVLAPTRCDFDDNHRDQRCTYFCFDDSRKSFNNPAYCFDDSHVDTSCVRIRTAQSQGLAPTHCDFDDSRRDSCCTTLMTRVTSCSMIQLAASMTTCWLEGPRGQKSLGGPH